MPAVDLPYLHNIGCVYDMFRHRIPKDSVVTGSYRLAPTEDFPRHYPSTIARSLSRAVGVGFAVMSGFDKWSHLH